MNNKSVHCKSYIQSCITKIYFVSNCSLSRFYCNKGKSYILKDSRGLFMTRSCVVRKNENDKNIDIPSKYRFFLTKCNKKRVIFRPHDRIKTYET